MPDEETWYTCDRCGEYHQREFSLLCQECEWEVEEQIAEDEMHVY